MDTKIKGLRLNSIFEYQKWYEIKPFAANWITVNPTDQISWVLKSVGKKFFCL